VGTQMRIDSEALHGVYASRHVPGSNEPTLCPHYLAAAIYRWNEPGLTVRSPIGACRAGGPGSTIKSVYRSNRTTVNSIIHRQTSEI
jgi:hypothetical protein